jgi:hypothetical protein
MSEQENNSNDTNVAEETQLIMGKYKSVEDIVNAHKQLQSSNTKLFEENKRIKTEYHCPENYTIPDQHINADENVINSAKEESKDLNLTQSQFENILQKKVAYQASEKDRIDNLKKKYGEDHYKRIIGYIQDNEGFTEQEIKNFSNERIEKFNEQRTKYYDMNAQTQSTCFTGETKQERASRKYKAWMKARNSGDPKTEEYFNDYMSEKLAGD